MSLVNGVLVKAVIIVMSGISRFWCENESVARTPKVCRELTENTKSMQQRKNKGRKTTVTSVVTKDIPIGLGLGPTSFRKSCQHF